MLIGYGMQENGGVETDGVLSSQSMWLCPFFFIISFYLFSFKGSGEIEREREAREGVGWFF